MPIDELDVLKFSIQELKEDVKGINTKLSSIIASQTLAAITANDVRHIEDSIKASEDRYREDLHRVRGGVEKQRVEREMARKEFVKVTIATVLSLGTALAVAYLT